MRFTDDEKKMIDWLRKQHEGWRVVRVIILVSSLVSAMGAAWEFFTTGFGALPLLLMVAAASGASFTLGSWAGRPEISLLLKVIEAQESTDV